VYAVPFPGPGRKYQISTSGGQSLAWRDDGKEILYGTDEKVFAVPVDASGASLRIGQPTTLFGLGNITDGTAAADFRTFLVVKSEGEPQAAPLVVVVNWTADLAHR